MGVRKMWYNFSAPESRQSDLTVRIQRSIMLTLLELWQDLDSARPVSDDGNGLAPVIKVLGPLGSVYQVPLKVIETFDLGPLPVAVSLGVS